MREIEGNMGNERECGRGIVGWWEGGRVRRGEELDGCRNIFSIAKKKVSKRN